MFKGYTFGRFHSVSKVHASLFLYCCYDNSVLRVHVWSFQIGSFDTTVMVVLPLQIYYTGRRLTFVDMARQCSRLYLTRFLYIWQTLFQKYKCDRFPCDIQTKICLEHMKYSEAEYKYINTYRRTLDAK